MYLCTKNNGLMYRGNCKFKCDECGNTFHAPDFELAATVLTMPQKCPVCGSMHTWPAKFPSGFLGKYDPQRLMYVEIWKKMDEGRH